MAKSEPTLRNAQEGFPTGGDDAKGQRRLKRVGLQGAGSPWQHSIDLTFLPYSRPFSFLVSSSRAFGLRFRVEAGQGEKLERGM